MGESIHAVHNFGIYMATEGNFMKVVCSKDFIRDGEMHVLSSFHGCHEIEVTGISKGGFGFWC